MGCTSSAPAREVVEGVVVPEAEVDRANEFAGRGARGEYHNLVADHHSPHEHKDREDWPLAKLRERLAAAPAEAPLAAVVTTGAMNPLHAGHAQMLHQAAASRSLSLASGQSSMSVSGTTSLSTTTRSVTGSRAGSESPPLA